MHTLWHWILWALAAVAHDPDAIVAERARAAGLANVSYAALAKESTPQHPKPSPSPAPAPAPSVAACRECNGTGKVYRADGGYVRCKCGACSSGRCPTKTLP